MKTIMKLNKIPASIISSCCYFLFVLLAFSCSKENDNMNISSQNNGQAVQKSKKVGHKTTQKIVYVWEGYYQDVYCDGLVIDHLTGAPTITEIQFFEDGVLIGWNNHYDGEAISESTGEIFKIQDNDKTRGYIYSETITSGTTTWHYNLVGNMGHHYVGRMSFDWATWKDTPIKTLCLKNKNID